MSILIDRNTRLIIQGITGREGIFHAEQMKLYGTNVVGGVTPGKGGETVLGIPVFDTVKEATEETGADASVVFVPAKYTLESVLEAVEAGLKTVITIAEHIPVEHMIRARLFAKEHGVNLIGPNGFGVISPGKCKAGFMPHAIFGEGDVGIMSRSASNCYETVLCMKRYGLGQSTCVGIGGDMVPGMTFSELLPLFEADKETKTIVLIGEIGGSEEEIAADYIKKHISKPCIALIVGKNAPKERSMGHAGAIVGADGSGSAESKERAFISAGVLIAQSPQHIAEILKGR